MSERYRRSEEHLARAKRTIPLGAQTFSKSPTHLPYGAAPFYLARGRGSRVWDLDGNAYIDFVNALCAVTLGYCDPDVDAAVKAQLAEGVSFSLSHPLEAEVAELLCRLIPCAESVRFGKNGSDATSAAIRLARAHTGRERVAVCGYHGWQDWYIGSTARHLGVPRAVRELTHTFTYNEIDSLARVLDAHRGEFATVVLEPMAASFPRAGFLADVRELAHAHGALLVFDETITGFRFALGGAQQLFGVTPDLATFGKGVANGFPLAAVVGREAIMRGMEEIFFSTTFGGETLSLAAARATIEKMCREPVLETLRVRGQRILDGLGALLASSGAAEWISVSGHPSWSVVSFRDAPPYSSWDLKTYFLQELLVRGVLSLGSHNLSYAHSDADVDALLAAYAELLPSLVAAVREKRLERELRGERLAPLFRVRG
jgi:glutamate-1-semialdehyde aminotransferase